MNDLLVIDLRLVLGWFLQWVRRATYFVRYIEWVVQILHPTTPLHDGVIVEIFNRGVAGAGEVLILVEHGKAVWGNR